MFSNDRNTMRQVYFDAWARYGKGEILQGMDQAIIDLIINHPEYQFIFDDPERWQNEEQFPGTGNTNPFMHLGLHLAVIEQVQLDRPAGVRTAYESLSRQDSSEHETQHRVMDCLMRWLSDAGQQHSTPDERVYLESLQQKATRR